MQNNNVTANATPRIFVPSTVNKIESHKMDEDHIIGISHSPSSYCNGDVSHSLKREATVKDMTQKLAMVKSSSTMDELSLSSSSSSLAVGKSGPAGSIVGEMKGIISKAMEG